MADIKHSDIYEYQFISGIKASPGHSLLAFVVNRADRGSNSYRSHIWCMDTGTQQFTRLTAHGDESDFCWLDDHSILFPSSRSGKKAGETTFYRLDLNGGEAARQFTVPLEAEAFFPLEKGACFVTARTPCGTLPQEPENRAKLGKDYWVFDEIPFWEDGQGKTSRTRKRGFVFYPEEERLVQVTSEYFALEGAEASPAGDKIILWGAEYTDVRPACGQVLQYEPATGKTSVLLPPGEFKVDFACCFGEDVLVAGAKAGENATAEEGLYLLCPETGETRYFFPLERSYGRRWAEDIPFGGFKWKVAEEKLYTLRLGRGGTEVISVSKAGHCEVLACFEEVSGLEVSGGRIYCAALNGHSLQELYRLLPEAGSIEKISDFNEEFLAGHSPGIPEHFQFSSRGGCELGGWVIRPAGYCPGQKYPGVLVIHDGPKAAYSGQYSHEMQCLAACGNFVFCTNPRGSGGRGEAFATLAGGWGGDDYDDVMEFTDEVLRRFPEIDDRRLGVVGEGYGGYLVNWIIGHTKRFSAACSVEGISNLYTACLTGDRGYRYLPGQFEGATPWREDEKLWERSPLKYAGSVTTPTLFLHTEENYRNWMCEPLELFTSLQQRGVPTRVVMFSGAGRGSACPEAPKNCETRVLEMCNWFGSHLK